MGHRARSPLFPSRGSGWERSLDPIAVGETPIYGKPGMPKEAIDAFSQEVLARVPQRRFGRPEEIARAALFLASDDASFVTGGELAVDGGMTQL